jgi:UPF0755 protein
LVRAFFAGLLSLILVGVAVVGVLWFEYQRFLATPIEIVSAPAPEVASEPGSSPESDAGPRSRPESAAWQASTPEAETGLPPRRVFEIAPGTRLRDVAARLADEKLISDPYFFIALAYQQGLQNQIKAGEYAVVDGMRPPDLLERFATGRSIQYPVTLVEGRTFREVVDELAEVPVLRRELTGLSDAEIMARLGMEEAHPEGWLFPDTYLVSRDSTDVELLKRSHARMKQVLQAEWEQRDEGLPLETPYEALILASIIEKETGLAEERPAIGGVFTRRLQRGMRLQTDPTVIYGMGDAYDGNIRREDLRTRTPYNTYVIDGLPPTPIALPGREAIRAALQPADGKALYFVSRGDGSHHFSATLDEHNCAVRKYQLGGQCGLLQDTDP